MEPSSQDFISISSQFTRLTPLPNGKHSAQLLAKSVFAAVVITVILLFISSLLRKCLNFFCNNRTLINRSTSCTTPSNSNPNTLEHLSVISLITYDAAPSPSFPEMLLHKSCCICLSDYENGDQVAMLKRCKHGFHVDCISQWLPQRSVLCPVCRAPAMEGKDSSSSSSLSVGNYSSSSAFFPGVGIQTAQPQLVY